MLLSRHRQQALSELVRLVGRGLDDDGDAEALCELLVRATAAQAASFGDDPHVGAWQHGHGIPTTWAPGHARAPHPDPATVPLGAAPPATFQLWRRDVGDGPDPTTRCHREAGFRDRATVRLCNPFVPSLFLSLYRAAGQPHFDDDDLELLALLYPHLVGALGARRALALLGHPAMPRGHGAGTVEIAWDRVEARSVVCWTAEARRLWRRHVNAVAHVDASETGDAWGRVERLVVRAASRFCAGVDGRSQVVVPGLRLEFIDVGPHDGELRRLRATTVEERGAPTTAEAPALALLSKRQREIARLAASGGSSADIAGALGIRPETARSHLKAIYGRLGVSSRVELARLLFDPQA